jgi:hypothetical protein
MADPEDPKTAAVGVGEEVADAVQYAAGLAAQADQIAGTAKTLVASAGTGFKLDPEAAAALITGCRKSIDEIARARKYAAALSAPPALGDLKGAKSISKFTQAVATDERGMLHALDGLTRTLEQMMAAYEKASANYQETEELVTKMLNAQSTELPPSGFAK